MSARARALVWAAAGLAMLAAALWLTGFGPFTRDAHDPRDDPDRIALGRTLYDAHCAACHGADLEGAPDWQVPGPDGRLPAPPHDATGHTWHHPDEMLLIMTRDGIGAVVPGYESDMPAFGGILEDDEIRAILAFIRSTWPADIRDIHDRINAEARGRGDG
jgi:mono/diheme cytochrome c family protein